MQQRLIVFGVALGLVGVSTACISYQLHEPARTQQAALPYGWNDDARGASSPMVGGEEGRKERFLLAPANSPRLAMPTMPNGRPATGFMAGSGEATATDDEGHQWMRGSNGWIPVYR